VSLGAKRGRARALLLRLLAMPLTAVFVLADVIASRLIQRR
jgi:hypothetical protein